MAFYIRPLPISDSGGGADPIPSYEWRSSWPTTAKCVATVAIVASGLFAPVYTPPVATAVDMDWLTPLSTPVPAKRSLHPSLQDATAEAYQTTTPEVVTVDKWFDGLSIPNRAKQRAIADYAFAPLAISEVVTIDKWFNPLAPPQNAKRGLNVALQRTLATEYFPDAPNAIAGQWYGSFSEPTRVQSRFSALYQAYTTEYYPDTFTQWFTPFSEPTRSDRSLNAPDQSQVPFTTTEVVTVDKWRSPWTEPLRLRARAIALDQSLVPFVTTENVTVDKWFDALSEPVRIRNSLRVSDQGYVQLVTTETITVDKWLGALSEPTRVKRTPTAQDQSWLPFVTTPEVVTVDKWFDLLSEPIRTKSALRAALQPATTYDAKLFPDPANFLEGWSSGLAEPVRQKLGLNTALQSAYTTGYFSFEIITVDKWYGALSEPKRFLPAVPVSLQTIGSPSFEVVTVDKWYAPLSDPKRFRPALHVSLQQTVTQDTVFIPSPSQYQGWYGALSEPQRQQVGLKAAQQVPYSSSYVNVAVEVITVDKWFKSFADPVRPERPADDRYAGENNWEAVAASMEWFAPFTEPVRQKIGLPATQQQALVYSVFTTPEIVTVDKWFKSFAEPIRVPARLGTATQQAFFYGTLKPQITFGYYNWLSEPVRQKKGLGTHLQSTTTQDPKLFPNPSRFLEGWFNWWSQPVRHLPQLNAALQRSWTASDRRPVLATITVTMAVTEVNDDVALFAIKVFAGNPPATAVVSLVEIGHGASLTSIVEEGDDGSGTSIVES